jgi:pilus assembly protein TadC
VIAERPWASLLALATGLLLWPSARAVVAGRLRGLSVGAVPPTSGGTAGQERRVDPDLRRRWLAVAGGLAAGLLVGGAVGVGGAVAMAVLLDRLMRRAEPSAHQVTGAQLRRDLPVACDLLAVCLRAGLPVGAALAAVGEAVPGALGDRVRGVAALYRLGAEPHRAWAEVPAELAALGRTLVRAGESGASVGPALTALAADTRASARALVEVEVRRAGVWVLAPLGLCFLPAFVCLGVVPLVLGIAEGVFG